MLSLKQYNNDINQLKLLTRFQTDFTYQCGISVADVSPSETLEMSMNKEKWLFSQAIVTITILFLNFNILC